MSINDLLDSLFRRHKEELVVFAHQKGNYQTAEDLVQDTFLRLLQHRDIHSIENHRAYLFKVTSNLSADQFHGKPIVEHLDEEEADLNSIACAMPQPDKAAESLEKYRLCMQALDNLPEMMRTVFLLHRIDGIPQAEIARTFNLPLRTVERYCAKALAHCCDTLKNFQY